MYKISDSLIHLIQLTWSWNNKVRACWTFQAGLTTNQQQGADTWHNWQSLKCIWLPKKALHFFGTCSPALGSHQGDRSTWVLSVHRGWWCLCSRTRSASHKSLMNLGLGDSHSKWLQMLYWERYHTILRVLRPEQRVAATFIWWWSQ